MRAHYTSRQEQKPSIHIAATKMDVRSTLECGGSTPLWNNPKQNNQGGVEPPHSKVLRTFSCTVSRHSLMGICGEIVSLAAP